MERQSVAVSAETEILEYHYPKIVLRIKCSERHVRAQHCARFRQTAGLRAHLSNLQRTRSGNFRLEQCLDGAILWEDDRASQIREALKKSVLTTLDQYLAEGVQPAVLTVGNFDGVHLGHQSILKKVVELSQSRHLLSSVITFKNHPISVLRPHYPLHLLTTPEHKLKLLEALGIDIAFVLEFDQALSEQSALAFLTQAKKAIPFRYLILGYDFKLGKDRQGDQVYIRELASEMHFSVDYLKPFCIDGQPVSSSFIRKCVQEDDLETAHKLLGRPYSIYTQVQDGNYMDLSGLCIPSFRGLCRPYRRL